MSALLHISDVSVAWAVLAAMSACACPGCCCWNLGGEGFPHEVQRMTEGVRPTEPKNERWGVSTKSREIERNLGVGEIYRPKCSRSKRKFRSREPTLTRAAPAGTIHARLVCPLT